MTIFGQLIIGPPGCGKSTYCAETEKLLTELGRKVAIINFDPANDSLPYTASIDINEYVTVSDAMQYMKLGPNGAMLFCMEYIEKHVEDIIEKIKQKSDHYFLIDCPGQVELYTHHNSLRNIINSLEKIDFRLCCVNLVDAHYCSDGVTKYFHPQNGSSIAFFPHTYVFAQGKYISSTLICLSTMLHLALPHVNVLSKIDMVKKFGDRLAFNVNYYTEVLDLSYLVESLENTFSTKYQKLNEHLASLVEDYSLVRFLPLNIKDRKLLLSVQNMIDKANGYLFTTGEERNIQKLLSSVMSNTEYDCEFPEIGDAE